MDDILHDELLADCEAPPSVGRRLARSARDCEDSPMTRWMVLGLLALAACATPPPRDVHWRRTSDAAEPLEQARSACRAHAMDRSAGVRPQGMAAKAAAGAFAECMQERGWVLVDQE
jgi:hypothetical protein